MLLANIILTGLSGFVGAQVSVAIRKCNEFYPEKKAFGDLWEEFPTRHVEAKRNEFPFLVAVVGEDDDGNFSYMCAGVLIDPKYVLCPANCVRSKRLEGKSIVIYVGKRDISNPQALSGKIAAKRIILHPEYKKPQIYNRIALIKLKKRASAPPACLWDGDLTYLPNNLVAYHRESKKLYKTALTAVDSEECTDSLKLSRNKLPNGITSNLFCLQDNSRNCQSTAGPDIAQRNEGKVKIPYVLGILNTGLGCGDESALFSKIPEYVDWIASTIWPND